MFYSLLSQRTVIRLRGEDTIDLLQGLITNDARLLLDGKPIYAALLSPQGKFLHDFFLIPWQESIFIDIRSDRVQDLLSRLKIYRLRSKVEIELDESVSVVALWNDHPVFSSCHLALVAGSANKTMDEDCISIPRNKCGVTDFKVYQDPRLLSLGFRAIGDKEFINNFCKENSYNSTPEDEYEHLRLSLCVPDTRDMIVGKSLLLECGFERLNGMDFGKGCYVGQEVTARSKFRGKVRKSFYYAESNQNLPEAGTQIMAGDKAIGEMRTSLNNTGIILIYNDKYEAAMNKKLEFLCKGIKLNIDLLK